MKKIIAVFVVAIIGYFCFTVIYSGNKVDAFYTSNNIIYDRNGVKWELTSSEKGLFSATYKSKITYTYSGFNESFTVIDRASFGLRGFNLSKIGSLTSELKLSEFSDNIPIKFKDVTYDSSIGFNGFDTVIDIKEGDYRDDDIVFSWKPLRFESFLSYDKNTINVNSDISYLHLLIEDEDIDLEIKNIKYNSKTSTKNINFMLGKNNFMFEKLLLSAEDINFTLDGLDIKSELKEGKNDTLTSLSEIGFKKFSVYDEYRGEGVEVDNLRFDIDLYNVDTKSMIKIHDSLSGLDTTNQMEVMFALLSWASYAPDMLKKQPKLILKDISAKYENEDHKITGFIQYVGEGNYQNYSSAEDALRDLKAEFKVNIGHNLFITLIENNSGIDRSDVELLKYELEEIEDDFNIKSDGKNVKIDFKIENGKIIINGKDVTKEF